ncbi:MAG: SusC/RagA family TonB-linked outer membrane protein [Mucilaginibacter sp.]|uniref:SusC/RagA family TonB-linked outer membrane protein n=1 Tax=Mucilaginibacter sp. TaxID=1882438 RepID=UPI0031A135A5
MRLTTLGILFCIMQVSAATFAQRITLRAKNISYEKLFKTIEQQSGYTFVYDPDVLRALPNFNIEISDANLIEVMDRTLANKPLNYKIIDNTVVVRLKETPITMVQSNKAILISGIVTGQNNHPLPGVTVKVKGSTIITGWVTNAQGRFVALVESKDVVLIFSYVGYQTQEVRVEDIKTPVGFALQLKEDIGKLDEIQIIAYGQTTKRLNVGDQTTVTSKEIEKYPVGNILSVLQGTVPGMVVSQSTGQAGGTYNVIIRGQNGLSTGTDPLYIVDGIPYQGGGYSSQKYNFLGSNAQAYDALSFINPQDIESVNVLKDAAATAIYGSRGANGVILITTKKGKTGNAKIDVNVYSGISQAVATPQMLNTQQYLLMRQEARRNDNQKLNGGLLPDYDINGAWGDTTQYTNWPKKFLAAKGHTTNAQLSISGGSDKTLYLISGNYRNVTNVQQLIGQGDQTSTLHFSLSSASKDNRFNITLTGGYTYDNNTIPSADLSGSASLAPNAPALFNPDGTLNFQNNTFDNPLRSKYLLAKTTVSNLVSSMTLSYQVLKNLKIQTTLGYNKQSLNEFLGSTMASLSPTLIGLGIKGSSNFSFDNISSWSVEPMAIYNTHIGKGALTVTIGESLQKKTTEATQLQANGYNSDLLIYNIGAGTSVTPVSGGYGAYDFKFNGTFGRINYNWEDKYVLELSGRSDGSSYFGPDHQFHLFFGAGANWIFSSEKFIKNGVPFLSFGKIRASYGSTGNDQIGPYNYKQIYGILTSTTTGPYQGIAGIKPNNLANPDLTWETVKKANLGIELQFLKGRIGLESNYFLNRTSHILQTIPLASTTGFANIYQNIDAKVQNKGFDVTLNTVNIQGKDFNWSTTVTFSRQRNALVSYPNPNPAILQKLGASVNTRFVNRYAGVNPQTGLYQFYDKDGNIVSTPSTSGSDQVKLIDLNPDFFGTVANTISYKGFSLSVLFRGIKQLGVSPFAQIVSSGNSLYAPGSTGINYPVAVLNRWQKPGDNARFARFSSTLLGPVTINKNNINPNLDAYYSDASYIRLQNASLSYQLPSQIAGKLHLKNLRIYALGENLATISNYELGDPETQSYLRIPPLRTITLGLQATL